MGIELTKKQSEAFDAINSPEIEEIMYGGAKGGGKTVFGCFWSFLQAYELARKYVPEPRKDPIPVGWMGRKIAKDFKDTTLETWKRFVPSDRYEIKGDPATIIISHRVKILTGGLDRREDVNKFNSAEFAFFFIDQAEETVEDDISVLRASLRLIINGHKIEGKALFTANPAQCWLKQEFITEPTPGHVFIQALPGDNPYLDEKYIRKLKYSFRHRPDLLEAYLYGNWDAIEGSDQVIKDIWIREALKRYSDYPYYKEIIAIDTARFGDDDTVIQRLQNANIAEAVTMPYCKTTQISNKAAAMSRQNENCPIVVESTGGDLGAGVIDELQELGCNVFTFCPQGAADDPEHFVNLRAEAWNHAACMMALGIFDEEHNVLFTCDGMYEQLREQLCWPKYRFRSGKTLIESKADIKARMGGKSPDHGDCYMIGLWGQRFVDYVRQPQESVYRQKTSNIESAMCC